MLSLIDEGLIGTVVDEAPCFEHQCNHERFKGKQGANSCS